MNEHASIYVLIFFSCISQYISASPSKPGQTCTRTICQAVDEVPKKLVKTTPVPLNLKGKVGPDGPRGDVGEKGEECNCKIIDKGFEEIENSTHHSEKSYSDLKQLLSWTSSCLQWKLNGKNESGIYMIQTDDGSPAFEAYCEMESAGGGWTLVASIHENNIHGKCTPGDLWSSTQGRNNGGRTETSNWENFITFGSVEAATSADYKSKAYWSLNASDVMIWHVPNDIEINTASEKATLKYFTDSNFLFNYGGSLRTLFGNHYQLNQDIKEDDAPQSKLRNWISALNTSAQAIRRLIPFFDKYSYVDGEIQMDYYGRHQYDSGIKLFYKIGRHSITRIKANKEYRDAASDVDILSATSHPFNLLMWIGNENRRTSSFVLKAVGRTGARGRGSGRSVSNTIMHFNARSKQFHGFQNMGGRRNSLSAYNLKYNAYTIYSTGVHTICKVFYYIYNKARWNSATPSVTRSPWTSGTDPAKHGIILSGSPRSILVGFTVLSRSDGRYMSKTYIDSVMSKILEVISTNDEITEEYEGSSSGYSGRIPEEYEESSGGISDCVDSDDEDCLTWKNCRNTMNSLIQPIHYIKGNDFEVLKNIPRDLKPDTDPGYIQFRPSNGEGVPYALCPGVKTTSCACRAVCVGGIHTSSENCGDFGDKLLAESSILIFTRKDD